MNYVPLFPLLFSLFLLQGARFHVLEVHGVTILEDLVGAVLPPSPEEATALELRARARDLLALGLQRHATVGEDEIDVVPPWICGGTAAVS